MSEQEHNERQPRRIRPLRPRRPDERLRPEYPTSRPPAPEPTAPEPPAPAPVDEARDEVIPPPENETAAADDAAALEEPEHPMDDAVIIDDDAVIVPPPAPEVFAPRHPPARTAHHSISATAARRTLIPIMLTLGVALPLVGLWWFTRGAQSPLRAAGVAFPITMFVLGGVMLTLAVMNMLQVRALLRRNAQPPPSSPPPVTR